MKRFGFTLAEVLITLGIIGVVAAMTMPTLINKTNGAQYKAAYKKALSVLSQAGTLNYELEGWAFSDVFREAEYDIDFSDPTGPPREYFNQVHPEQSIQNLCKKQMQVLKTEFGHDKWWSYTENSTDSVSEFYGGMGTLVPSEPVIITFADGITLVYDGWGADAGKAYIDVNGPKGPNKVVSCDEPWSDGDNCIVSNPTDIYPIKLTGNLALPLTPAAKAVLYGK